MEPCPGPATLLAVTCTLCWCVCEYVRVDEHAHLRLCRLVSTQMPCVIGQASMEALPLPERA